MKKFLQGLDPISVLLGATFGVIVTGCLIALACAWLKPLLCN